MISNGSTALWVSIGMAIEVADDERLDLLAEAYALVATAVPGGATAVRVVHGIRQPRVAHREEPTARRVAQAVPGSSSRPLSLI